MLHAWERVFRQQRSRIKSGMTTELLRNDSCYMYLLKLWLCEPLYLPPLRGTFFQKKACVVRAARDFLCAFGAPHHPALRATFFPKKA